MEWSTWPAYSLTSPIWTCILDDACCPCPCGNQYQKQVVDNEQMSLIPIVINLGHFDPPKNAAIGMILLPLESYRSQLFKAVQVVYIRVVELQTLFSVKHMGDTLNKGHWDPHDCRKPRYLCNTRR